MEQPMKKFDGVGDERAGSRRSFMKRGIVAAGATAAGGGLMSRALFAFGRQPAGERLTRGDVAILRLLAAAETIEAELWQQYNELAGVNAAPLGYTVALQQLDGDMPRYISDNTDDESWADGWRSFERWHITHAVQRNFTKKS
jgi:hypothetical protein